MKTKYLFFLVFFLYFSSKIKAQNRAITWLNPLQLADSMRAKPKSILIYIHTSWCNYCKMQEKQTFGNEEVISKLNEDFYAFAFDAESKESIYFAGKTYHYQANGANTGLHELATFLATKNGQISYPTLLILNEKFELLYRNVGFMAATDLINVVEVIKKH